MGLRLLLTDITNSLRAGLDSYFFRQLFPRPYQRIFAAYNYTYYAEYVYYYST